MRRLYQGVLQGAGGTIVRHGGKTDGIMTAVHCDDGVFVARVKNTEDGEAGISIEVMPRGNVCIPTMHGEPVGTLIYTGLMRDFTQCDQMVLYRNGIPLSEYLLSQNEAQ